MKFDMTNIHTIFEAAKEESPKQNATNDETGANLDNTLGDNDLLAIFDDICPISGDVFASMKNAASDPKNLKITMVKSGNGEDPKLFIEAVEFATFCEACGCNVGEAAEEIIGAYREEVPEMDNAEIHVVFPSDSLNKNVLGSENYGLDTRNDWAMQLMRGCRRYGLKVNSGVEGIQESGARQKYVNQQIAIANNKYKSDNQQQDASWKAAKYGAGVTTKGNFKFDTGVTSRSMNNNPDFPYHGDKQHDSRKGKEEFKKDFHDHSVDKLAEKKPGEVKEKQDAKKTINEGFGRHFEHIETRLEKNAKNDNGSNDSSSSKEEYNKKLGDIRNKMNSLLFADDEPDSYYDKSLAKMNEASTEKGKGKEYYASSNHTEKFILYDKDIPIIKKYTNDACKKIFANLDDDYKKYITSLPKFDKILDDGYAFILLAGISDKAYANGYGLDFQRDVRIYLDKCKELSRYSFETEDYPGILINCHSYN